jgi:hypothetical protein
MRARPVSAALIPAIALLASCSSTPTVPQAAVPAPSATPSCALAVRAWSQGRGGAAFRRALTASSAMRAAVKDDDSEKAVAETQKMRSAAHRADGYQPPACADTKHQYRLAMSDWVIAAKDASAGDLTGTSTEIVAGADDLDAVIALRSLSPATLVRLTRRVEVAAPSRPAAPATSPAPVTSSAPPPAAQPSAASAPTGCYPISDEGTCYEPGEYCRDDDHGMTGVAGDGETITCEDNDGWRWEPS